MGFILVVSVILVLAMVGLGLSCIIKGTNGKNMKKVLGINVLSFFSILAGSLVMLVSKNVMAAGETAAEAASSGNGLAYIAAALSTGLATIGAGIAVAVSGSAALGAISENDKLLGKTLIFVGLAEGIAIYGLIVSILILGKI